MDRKEFARRRRQFMRMIGKDAIAILPAAPVRHRNGDIEYAYRQDSHFYYLSGFPEPDAVAVLVPGRPHAEYLLFVREHDALRESWDGARAGTEGAVEHYGADDAFPIEDIDEILPGLMEQRSQIYYSMGTHPEFDPRILSWVNGLRVQSRQGAGGLHEFVALRHVLDDMRLYKSRAEQASLRRAAQIAVGAHRRAMRFARPGRMEYEVMAEVLHEFRSHNADISYYPIVGGGANACVMHYRDNDQPLCDGDLVAARCGLRARLLRLGYHAHISGQRQIHRSATRGLRNGAGGAARGHRQGALAETTGIIRTKPPCASVTQGLVKLGLLKGSPPIDQGPGVPAVFQSPHRALARARRARCGRLQSGRRMAGAGAGHGAHRRAGDLHSPLAASSEGILEHRHSHRG